MVGGLGGSTLEVQLQGARVAMVNFPGGPKQDALSKAQVEPAKPHVNPADCTLGTFAKFAKVTTIIQGSRHSLL